ncbi:MAG: hypothetical protein JST19_04295 [Bacteroidetes bacterium]|nr:hypothetical protein [Bacteroidota bacterium]
MIGIISVSQAQSSSDLVIVKLGQSTTLIVKDNSFAKIKRDSLKLVTDVLSRQLLNASSTPKEAFLSSIQDDIDFLNLLKNNKTTDSTSRNQNLDNVIADLKLKTKLGKKEKFNLSDELVFEVAVNVKTRKLVNGRFVLVSGYNVYANPWIIGTVLPARIKFTNSTSPGSTYNLPPGRYHLWVEDTQHNKKSYPVKVEYTDIGTDSTNKPITIFIDVEN